MSVPALAPTASTTLVIVLGASAWPNSPGFQASEAFVHAAQEFQDYLLDSQGFGLPAANLLNLFDAPSGASDQLEQLGSFLDERTQTLKEAKQAARDVLVYFVGHGGFVGSSHDFYLMPRRANASSLRASGLSIDALAEVLREKARHTRQYLFLDCCFAAAAFRYFQGAPDQTAIEKTLDAFAVRARSIGFARRGTALLCSSDQKSPSLLLPDESCTMFSRALIDVLKNGDLHRPHPMSLRDIKELTKDRLVELPEKNAPRPGLYSPDQSEGDVADIPLFPNWRAEEERRRQAEETKQLQAEERTRSIEEEQVRKAKEALGEQSSPLLSQVSRSTAPSSTFISPSLTSQNLLKSLRPRGVITLVLAILVLLGGAGASIYGASTGRWFGLVQQPSTAKTTLAQKTATALAHATMDASNGQFGVAEDATYDPVFVIHIMNSSPTGTGCTPGCFIPLNVKVKIGTKIDWVNYTAVEQNVTAIKGLNPSTKVPAPEIFYSGTIGIKLGSVFSYTVSQAAYNLNPTHQVIYYSTFHPTMVAMLTIVQ